MAGEEDTTVVAPEIETQAREMGWRPKEEFKGAEDKWVDAVTFVERGEHVLPIVKETNKRLREDLRLANEKMTSLEQAVLQSQQTIAALDKYHKEDVKQKVETARKRLKEELIAAKKSGDVEAEVNLTEELTTLNAAETARVDPPVVNKPAPKDFTKEPIFVEWKEANPWFGSDKARTAIAYQVTTELRSQGETSVGREFLDKVTQEVNKEVARLGGRTHANKVEAGRGGATGGNGAGKTYADLSAEAKAACRSFVPDLVGPNKLYKTEADWQKKYAADFFAEV